METTVESVMTTDVVSVGERTPFKEIVETMRRGRVHAVPVVDADGRVTGIVSSGDLIMKEADPTAAEEEHLLATPRRHREWRKASGTVAAELMSSPARTIRPEATVREAAREMHRHRVGRLPVVEPDAGTLVGIVSRSDILSVYERPDEEIEHDIRAELDRHPLGPRPADLEVSVERGRAHVYGRVALRSQIPALMHHVRRVEGVVSAQSHLTWDTDDLITWRYPYL